MSLLDDLLTFLGFETRDSSNYLHPKNSILGQEQAALDRLEAIDMSLDIGRGVVYAIAPADAVAEALRIGPRFGGVGLAALGTGADDVARNVAVWAACAGKYEYEQLPGTWYDGAVAYTIKPGVRYIEAVNKTGATSVRGTILASDDALVFAGDTVAALASLVVTGANMNNTLSGMLYAVISGHGANTTLTLYSDAAKTVSVAIGALVGHAGGAVVLAEVARSGLSATWTAPVDPADNAAIVVTIGTAGAVKIAPAYATGVRGVVLDSGIIAANTIRVGTSGIVSVLLKDATAAVKGGWIYTSNVAGCAVCALLRIDSMIEQQIGYALEDVAAGVGKTVLVQLALR